MTRFGEGVAFTGIAVLVHVGLLVQFGPSGAQSQGAAGQASIALMVSSGDMAERVAAWTRPVEVMQALAVNPVPAIEEYPSTPAVSRPPVPDALPTLPKLPALTAAAPVVMPRIDTQTAEPIGPRHAPAASPRPKERAVQKPEPAAKPKKRERQTASAPAKQQKAKGGQSGQNAGNAKVKQSASVSKATRRSLMAKWGASIRNRVERRKRYPSGTTASGTTVLRITISRGGRLKAVSVVKSSGSRSLDKAAVKAVQRARYAAAPKGLNAAQYSFNLPLAFKRK